MMKENAMGFYTRYQPLWLVALVFVLACWPLHASWAAAGPVCTDFAKLATDMDSGKPGILTEITTYLKDVIGTASRDLFEAFTSSSAYQSAVNAAAILMVLIYGVGFTIGVTQASFGEVLKRMIKLGLIFTIISPSGWGFFSDYVVTFFNDGTDEIIGKVIEIGTGVPYTPGSSPFLQLDGIANFIISPDMIMAVMGATFSSGPYGIAAGGLLAFAVTGVISMLLQALQTYALSFLVRAMLLGVAPIFIVFLLFDRTKNLFTGWLNALINLSLQPILYFTFISFFIVMMQGAAKDMFGANGTGNSVELCWTEFKNQEGTNNKTAFWRFKMPGEKAASVEGWDWRGSISCRLEGRSTCAPFPLNVIDMLTFLILVYVAQRFSGVVERIASEISSSTVALDKNMRFLMEQDNKHAAAGANKNTGGAAPPPPLGTKRK